MSEQAEGWHTDASGLRVKKWDPHRGTRRRGYSGSSSSTRRGGSRARASASYASNQPGTLAARGAAARAKAQQSRDARVGRRRSSTTATRRRSCGARSRAPRRAPRERPLHGGRLPRRVRPRERRPGAGRRPAAVAACAFSRARVASWGNREVDAAAADAFRRGPRDPRGALVDCSDRPLLAMSVSDDGADVVAGGADHAAHGVKDGGGCGRQAPAPVRGQGASSSMVGDGRRALRLPRTLASAAPTGGSASWRSPAASGWRSPVTTSATMPQAASCRAAGRRARNMEHRRRRVKARGSSMSLGRCAREAVLKPAPGGRRERVRCVSPKKINLK